MGVSKVEFGGDTLIDLTSDTVTPETLAEGETAHNAAGEEITGTLKVQDEIVTTTGTGKIYEVTVRGITALKNGVSFVMIPHETNTNNFPKLNVNGLGEINIWRRTSTGGIISVSPNLLLTGVPYRVVFCENMLGSGSHVWELADIPKPVADDLTGLVPVANGGMPIWLGQPKGNVLTINESGTPEWQEPSGGSSTPSVSLIGTWTVIENPEIPKSDIPLEFTSNGVDYMAIGTTSMGSSSWGINALSYKLPEGYYDAAYVNNPSESYGINHGWRNETYRYLTVTKEPESREAIAWLGNNTDAPKVELPEMPQIRFANFQKVELWDEETETLSTRYRFTVENLGGGTLQVGDKLQICCRRKYPNGKKKLRRMADIEITENDLNQRFLKIEVDPEDESVQKWLFRNDRNQSSVTTLSAMYFRLKRVTKYSDSDGKECNAIFSNVEQVWKTYILPCNGGWELNIK